jgi:hypothetical protein
MARLISQADATVVASLFQAQGTVASEGVARGKGQDRNLWSSFIGLDA